MNSVRPAVSIWDRRNFCGSVAGVAAFLAALPFGRPDSEFSLETAHADEEFEIVNGWVLHRKDVATRK